MMDMEYDQAVSEQKKELKEYKRKAKTQHTSVELALPTIEKRSPSDPRR
jgi:hypothetical protein